MDYFLRIVCHDFWLDDGVIDEEITRKGKLKSNLEKVSYVSLFKLMFGDENIQ